MAVGHPQSHEKGRNVHDNLQDGEAMSITDSHDCDWKTVDNPSNRTK